MEAPGTSTIEPDARRGSGQRSHADFDAHSASSAWVEPEAAADGRYERRAANESMFRRGTALAGRAVGELELPCRCECQRRHCDCILRLTAHDYAAVCRCAGRFVVRPGHQRDDLEMVVGHIDSYVLVQPAPSELFLG